jgi:hypothetical protein
MTHYFKIAVIGLVVFLSSCEKVINIDLESNEPLIMIEGVVTDDPTIPSTVKITKSVNFSESNNFPAVSNADVTILDDLGNAFVLSETSPGVYQNSSLVGVSGRTYYLTVYIDGKTYTSVSKMPQNVNLDTISVGEGMGPGAEDLKSITPVYTDPVGKGNYYRFKLKKNSEMSSSILLADDQAVDGGTNNTSLFDQNLEFKVGDTAVVTMMCIDKPVHLYFYSLNQNGSGPGASATPANPVTNIEGATLGYFSAQTIQTKQVVIQ